MDALKQRNTLALNVLCDIEIFILQREIAS